MSKSLLNCRGARTVDSLSGGCLFLVAYFVDLGTARNIKKIPKTGKDTHLTVIFKSWLAGGPDGAMTLTFFSVGSIISLIGDVSA